MTNKAKTPVETNNPTKLRKFLYGLSWVIIWPIVVAIPAVVVMLLVLSYIVTTAGPELNETISRDGIFYFELYLFVFVTGLVGILYLVKWLFRTRKYLFLRSGANVLGVYIWVGIFATGFVMVSVTKNPDVIKPPVVKDEHLMQVIATVGADDGKLEDVSVSYVDTYKEEGRQGEYTPYMDSKGAFAYGTISIKKGLNADDEKVVVAHEYLHHIWEAHMDEQQRHDLTSQLMTLYGKDGWFKERVATYSDTNMLVPTELFSFYCTESSDKYLTPALIDECNRYIDRGTLTFVR